MGGEHIIMGGGVVRLTIDTRTDTHEQAIAAVQGAYGLRPDVPVAWPHAPAAEPRPGLQDLADDDLADGWTDQLLFQMVASLAPGARAVLSRITELDDATAYEEVQQHFADHPTNPIPPSRIGGTLTSVKRCRAESARRTAADFGRARGTTGWGAMPQAPVGG
ncbi:hypothetical protein [Streptomyces capillispiralis]|uniref:Uncharacterized protein n=1 Tax=Streptomyces capillispiralis TaxID=68182 RepID=A0A561SG83_9ACTN|nr:hypothetical protein [Streptomyces capillispiralis]TWF73885.1 hypothetical protein FHX78_134 [Streptomyces capillispiralis]GHE24162.1 hypothetical protein GCM10017779_71490 [Streptomyces capillispiralis]